MKADALRKKSFVKKKNLCKPIFRDVSLSSPYFCLTKMDYFIIADLENITTSVY